MTLKDKIMKMIEKDAWECSSCDRMNDADTEVCECKLEEKQNDTKR